MREIKEETGFNDFEIISQIKTYSYRFFDKGKIVHKVITCFLVRLKSLKRAKKQLGMHEAYRNCFFTFDKVIKKLSWAEDKEMIILAEKLILKNKNSPHSK